MMEKLKLMCVLAHPDDESLGMGGIFAKYADEGVGTYLVTATRGEQGWSGPEETRPEPEELGRIREAELHAAAEVLGIRDVQFLGYHDGELDRADPAEAIARIVDHLRRVRPHVVATFDPHGAYGHPDHIAICQLTTAAVVAAADPSFSHGSAEGAGRAPHRVSKLYYMVSTLEDMQVYQEAFGQLVMCIDGTERQATGWEPWAITARIDTRHCWERVWQAANCHLSQLPDGGVLHKIPKEQLQQIWGTQSYYRALSLVNGGREQETDLFAGLR